MATIDLSRQRQRLLGDAAVLSHLPPDLLEVVRSHVSSNFLDVVAAAALIPRVTGQIFIHFETVFADICARWFLRSQCHGQEDKIIAAFARILPFAPHVSVFLERYMQATSLTNEPTRPSQINSLNSPHTWQAPGIELLQSLLAFWRLLNFDKKAFGQLVSPSRIQSLFRHPWPSVRYLAVKILCLQLSASDYKVESLLSKHISEDVSLVADYDGVDIDYAFLSLFEHKRGRELDNFRQELQCHPDDSMAEAYPLQQLTHLVVCYGTNLLPRANGSPKTPPRLVYTPTTLLNLENLVQNLQQPWPILLYGLPGSGKTSLVHELARELGMDSGLVTLHLNEQTDAKMLIGLYSTDSKPGSFSWRSGVLTTAVREGRWVLIEDLDRAPNEVMSTLLPLVERGQLLITSRGETIQAPSTFRLFATVQTTRGMGGQESLPSLLGQRFWRPLSVRPTPDTELESIIAGEYPLLQMYTPMIMSVYRRLSSYTGLPHTARGTSDRPITPRDLFKWCRRLQELLVGAGCKTGGEPISETTRGWMFMEAVDCFCGNLSKQNVKASLVNSIAEEMHLPEQLTAHYLEAQIPQIEETPSTFRVGRVTLDRRKQVNRIDKSKRPFASTVHSKRLLEQIAVAVKLREPVLLVGETGIGKTTVVQQLADLLGHKLIAVNLSQQSEVGDLLGGFKPVNVRSLAIPLKEEFEDLFTSTGISIARNQKYMEQLGKYTAKGQWARVSKLWKEASRMFSNILEELQNRNEARNGYESGCEPTAKRRKTESKLQSLLNLKPRWEAFDRSIDQFDIQVSGRSGHFAFAFVEGNIVKAARNGDWVLLDEINLASPDTLESIADLLASGPNDEPSILLSETGEIERIVAHPNFRIFGAMNPATDIGKRDLPLGLRSRFTELYIGSPDKDLKDLLTVVKAYMSGKSSKDDQAADDIARLYLNTKARAEEKRLVDGANEVPHYSLRTLTRVLSYVNGVAPYYGLRRALFEGFSMGFLTLLDRASEETLVPLIHHHLLDRHANAKSLLSQPPRHPNDGKQYVKFTNKMKDRQYWLLQGAETPLERTDYIITPYIERNLLNLVRATSTRRFPILIQGPTSAGKTSMIEYLANYSGNKFIRINNHEHTDLQEYLGTYVSDADGRLRFQEGLLVQALRLGHWIVLDELNLAPTDVLEALNRLLDDNRELLLPETQEVVRPHENFMLFATQNPPGLYGGRKALSRAFRNRFLELHFDDIPEDELETILQKRSLNTAPSDCRRIVNVYKELSRLRQTSRLFENKESFATLRDLFRWTLRDAGTREDIAINGFMLLAERVRNEEERIAVKKVIESVFKVKIIPDQLYDPQKWPHLAPLSHHNGQGVVWTHAMRRLYVLVASALAHNEPVLLVGETGSGKTSVCQVLAELSGKQLHIVNAHQNTETGDLIGSQRPIRNRGTVVAALLDDVVKALDLLGHQTDGNLEDLLREYHALDADDLSRVPDGLRQRISDNEVKRKALFEWADGSLVHAMRDGQFFLLDEISLADDSVLERLNSVLEPQRSLLLAEKGTVDSFVKASDGFQFLATMNPGGDFGKKELSPALRNRFTEIWVPPLSENQDVLLIVKSKLKEQFRHLSSVIVEFSYWFGRNFRSTASTAFSIRDILVWVKFINETNSGSDAYRVVHGASMVFIDTLGANPSALIAVDPKKMDVQRKRCLDKLSELLGHDATTIYRAPLQLLVGQQSLAIGDFSIDRAVDGDLEASFALHAPTTKLNAMRIIRALHVQKPILLEGNPGVGKTTLVSALARACGRPLTRINLSDQTDLMDLFGTDVPIEGAEAGHFAWRDAPFLRAMQNGEWVLLDEMNLASQSVLEGLNACLDHRGEVYVSELDRVFKKHPGFRLFAAQNPHHQGGGRKGLPSSFVNRFIVVYADVFTEEDLLLIAQHNFPTVPTRTIGQMIRFISNLDKHTVVHRSFGSHGSPWEFNLRDMLRWLHLLTSTDPLLSTASVDDFLGIAIRQRFRDQNDKLEVDRLFEATFGAPPREHQLYFNSSPSSFQIGLALMPRDQLIRPLHFPSIDLRGRLAEAESLMICIKNSIPCILVGSSGSGKTMLLQHVAALAGKHLVTFPMNADVDTMDLVGGFEQSDPLREVNLALKELQEALQLLSSDIMPEPVPAVATDLQSVIDGMNGQMPELKHLSILVRNLRAQVSVNSELAGILARVESVLGRPTGIMEPRFEWLDGIIVQALQKGRWLVLDNANLCSASVLDRLNSLLEPNGYLIINEHCGQNGEPRLVRPHPDFRVFLTVDPRYGELSRAMRNRAVEIYIDCSESASAPWSQKMGHLEPSLRRYDLLSAAIATDAVCGTRASQVATDCLPFRDFSGLEGYRSYNTQVAVRRPSPLSSQEVAVFHRTMDLAISFARSSLTNNLRLTISALYTALPETHFPGLRGVQNSVLVPLLNGPYPELPFWLATCHESYLNILRAHDAMAAQRSKADGIQVSSLNRLQRSCMADSVAAVSKDSTVGAASFLVGALKAIDSYLQSQRDKPGLWKQRRGLLRNLMRSWWATFTYLCEGQFEEARFQAHLNHVSKTLSTQLLTLDEKEARDLISCVLDGLDECFVGGFKLTTGLNMESLWSALRPRAITSSQLLERVGRMERLASRFDAFKWRSAARLSDLAQITGSFAKTYSLIRRERPDVDELLNVVDHEMDQFDRQPDRAGAPPFLADEFEVIRQITILDQMSSPNDFSPMSDELALLSNLSLITQMRIQSASHTSMPLQSIGYLLGDRRSPYAWDGSFSVKLLSKLRSIDAANLDRLESLEIELPILAKQISSSTQALTDDRLGKLSKALWHILSSIVSIYDPSLTAMFMSARTASATSVASEFVSFSSQGLSFDTQKVPWVVNHDDLANYPDVVSKHMIPALVSLVAFECGLQGRRVYLANAWIQSSVAFIELFVPDKPYDPQLRPQVELASFEEMLRDLKEQLDALKIFERLHTGSSTNLRCALLEEEILALGKRPAIAQPVYRPIRSELLRIQGEFNSLLKTVLGVDISSVFFQHCFGSEGASQQLGVIRENISQIIHRLSHKFPAYEDITVPVVNMLQCLEIGLSLGATVRQSLVPAVSSMPLLRLTPLLGGQLDIPISSDIPTESFEFLAHAGTIVSVEGPQALKSSVSRPIFEVVHFFYDKWRQKLETDRKAEEARQSTYRYRGDVEEEEAATQQLFDELFPKFNKDGAVNNSANTRTGGTRALSIKLAEAHRAIFLAPQDASEAIQHLVALVARRLTDEGDATISDRVMLTAAMLALNQRLKELETQPSTASYNFYADRNLPEVRRLVSLVKDVKQRFRQLQQVDEIGHMQPLANVVSACDQVLELGYSDPLAKIIPRVEQLHAFVYEWQFGGWASKIHGALPLHNRLAEMLVSWRRLELSTWARLLDTEAKKCHDDASAWWFVAYQAIVAEPMSLAQDGQSLLDHAANLLQELHSYFLSASIGQFTGRLGLLRQLQAQVELLAAQQPAMSAIYEALVNFIGFFSRYETIVHDSIRAGRAPLEKQMKDILLLASWKDTNIAALRESAQRSHQKLFKIVRKFREVLSQPMKPIIDNGLPDQDGFGLPKGSAGTKAVQIDTSALVSCQNAVDSWTDDCKRLSNVHRTVDIMSKLSCTPITAIDAVGIIDAFLSNLSSSALELRKETPAILTNDNKNFVKHLKSRKRKLFAETLKETKRMGFKYNLGTDVLAMQNSLSAVLATSKDLSTASSADLRGAEYFFHKILDLAPSVRSAAQSHSDDLTSAEVERSIGVIEGILHVVLDQRQELHRLSKSDEILTKRVECLHAVAQSRGRGGVRIQEHAGNHRRAATWLTHILRVGIQLIELHAKLGSADNNDIVSLLNACLDQLRRLSSEWDSLLPLPDGLVSHQSLQLEARLEHFLSDLRTKLDEACHSRPDLAFLFEQIRLWAIADDRQTRALDSETQDISVLVDSTKKLCDVVLVSIEQFSQAISQLPTSDDEAGWLMQCSKVMVFSTRALHADQISETIESTINALKMLDLNGDAVNHIAVSLVAVVTSVIDQYLIIRRNSVGAYTLLHQRTCRLGYILCKNFTQLAAHGFCTPQEKPDETSGESDKLESGTGLGEGEGAEDMSKDIQPDEDLSELAQEGNKSSREAIEDEKDAVDMADEELEGDVESVSGIEEDEKESKSGDNGEGGDDIEEETGNVDDLDPSAVDEKLWDGANEDEAEKDQQGDLSKGQKKQDEQLATKEKPENHDSQHEDSGDQFDDELIENLGQEQNEDVQVEDDTNRQDQHVQERDTLALPDDMEIDGNDNKSMSTISDDDLDDLSGIDQEGMIDHASDESVGGDIEIAHDENDGAQEENARIQEAEQQGVDPEGKHGDEETTEIPSADDGNASGNNIVPSDVKSGGQEPDNDHDDGRDDAQDKATQQDQGQLGEAAAEEAKSAGERGNVSQAPEKSTNSDPENSTGVTMHQPFKALGDALEKWHRQQQEIREAEEQPPEKQGSMIEQELDAREYQHLQNDEAAADTQALGTATEEQTRPVDDAMAIDDEDQPTDNRLAPENEAEGNDSENADTMDTSEQVNKRDQDERLKEEGRTGVSTRHGAYKRDFTPPTKGSSGAERVEETIQETSMRLSSTHISETSLQLRDFEEAMEQWSSLQTRTHELSMALTSQLRLILTPSQATKLSGSYRTGKRLNIKRIIPYIASSYKRDKIWMRRTIPTKRSYQILLCVDDSRSMGDSSSGELALESLVMVSRALTMLEVGQVGVLGFGRNTFIAHDFAEPFASHDAGARLLQKFSFQQEFTDIQLVIKQIIEQFRLARQQSASRGSEDLWQLALILSDGLTPSSAHEDIQVLLREALEERIMIVFIIMDDTSNKSNQSVINLKKVKFLGDDKVKTEYYLDTFPFQYYLIVHNLEDLPGALAGLLRTWFAEVNA
ncbi:hypothetical protein DL766_007274 [Monosporascus sp. MC13-8B]|nr:hypothetical protein DL763_008572 [Monosporascus cannonballus]RYP24413.1 hypothetical protein DL766_007274 [Monosporascus sp. MC13-8B]